MCVTLIEIYWLILSKKCPEQCCVIEKVVTSACEHIKIGECTLVKIFHLQIKFLGCLFIYWSSFSHVWRNYINIRDVTYSWKRFWFLHSVYCVNFKHNRGCVKVHSTHAKITRTTIDSIHKCSLEKESAVNHLLHIAGLIKYRMPNGYTTAGKQHIRLMRTCAFVLFWFNAVSGWWRFNHAHA